MRINTCQDGIRFSAIIQPRSSKNEVTGIYKDAIKVRLTSLLSMALLTNPVCVFSQSGWRWPHRILVLQGDIAVKIKLLKLWAFQKSSSSKF